jgi:hypothetical protein
MNGAGHLDLFQFALEEILFLRLKGDEKHTEYSIIQ